jgi:hypothetical protein
MALLIIKRPPTHDEIVRIRVGRASALRRFRMVGAWFSITPMTRALTSLAPVGALMSKSVASILRPTCTVLRALSG